MLKVKMQTSMNDELIRMMSHSATKKKRSSLKRGDKLVRNVTLNKKYIFFCLYTIKYIYWLSTFVVVVSPYI